MLGKLMKYDMRYMAKILPWMYLGGFGVSVLTATVILLASNGVTLVLGTMTFGLLFVLSLEAIAICSSVFMMVRIYKGMFSDEGYLTFTLPVKNTSVVSAKILTGAIWTLISYAVIFLMLLFPYLVLTRRMPDMLGVDLLRLAESLIDTVKEIIATKNAKAAVIGVLYIFIGIGYLFYNTALFTFSAAITHKTKKARGFASAAVFLGISFGINFIKSIFNAIVSEAFLRRVYNTGYTTTAFVGGLDGELDSLVDAQMNSRIATLSVEAVTVAAVVILSWYFAARIVKRNLDLQ